MRKNIVLIFIVFLLLGCKENENNAPDELIVNDNAVPATADFRTDQVEITMKDSILKHVLATLDKLVDNSGEYSIFDINEKFDSILLDNLTYDQKSKITEELLKVDENISQALYTRLLNPIDGMKGVVHEWGDEVESIDLLFNNPNNDFDDKNKFVVYSQYGKIEAEDIEIPASGVEPKFRRRILSLLRNRYNTKYQELLSRPEINDEQDLLDTYFLDKWTIVKALGYGDTLLTNEVHLDVAGNRVFTRFDVGAVCPPVCP